ncbi:MAG: fibronectin type III domain-containing protein, partial [Candidatus Aphodosoma sp.]
MKKLLFSFLCMICLLVPWQTMEAQGGQVTEDFEDVTSLPTGWTTAGTVSSSYQWNIFTGTSSSPAYEGAKCVCFNSWSAREGQTGILLSPAVTIVSPQAKVSFAIKNPTGGSLGVYVSTDGGSTYLNNPLDTNLTNISGWTVKSYSLASYVGQSVRIVFYSVSNYGSGDAYHYMDKFELGEPATCAQPINVTISSITQTTVNLMWNLDTVGDASSTYLLTVTDEDNNSLYNNQSITATELSGSYSYQLTGLTSGVQYFVSLKTDCSAAYRGYSEVSSTSSFTTLCSSVNFPYTCDFDSMEANANPDCWSVYAPSTATAVSTTTKYGSTGKSLKLYATTTDQVLVATQPLNHAANDMEVDFMFYAPSGTSFQVGLMSDPSDMSTFEQLYTAVVPTSSVWKNYRFNTSNSAQGTATNLHIAFVVSSGATRTCYLDNVNIHAIPSCPRLEDLTVISTDSVSVTLSWTDPLSGSSDYETEIVSADTTIYLTANYNPATIYGMSPQTDYTARVRSICSSNDTSEWSMSVSFRTKCGATTVPFTEDFNSSTSLPECWESTVLNAPLTGSGSVTGWTIFTTTSSSSYVRTGNSLKSPDSRSGTRYLLTLPAVRIPADQQQEISFWMYRNSNSVSIEGIKVYVNTQPTLTGAILLDSILNSYKGYPIEEKSGYYNYIYTIPMTGVVYVMFESTHAYQTAIYLEDITITPKVCHTKLTDIVENVDLDAQLFSSTWNHISDETSWLVNFELVKNDTNVVCNINSVVNTTAYTLDLSSYIEPASSYSYTMSIAGICNGNDTSTEVVIRTGNFDTPCEVMTLPIVEDFTTKVPPLCWSALTDPNSTEPTKQWIHNTSSSYGHTAGSAQFQDAKATTIGYLNSPRFTATAGTEYIVSFYQYRSSSYDTKYKEGIYVWLSTVESDTTNAVLIGSALRYNTSTGVQLMKYRFTPAVDGTYCIIFQALQEYGTANYIDDVIIEEAPTCVNINAGNVSLEEGIFDAQITINDTIANTYELYFAVGDNLNVDTLIANGTRVIADITPTNNVVTLTNLTPETDYSYVYRLVCDSLTDQYSAWNPVGTFTTQCAPVEVNDTSTFIESFESFTKGMYMNATASCNIVSGTLGYVKGSLSSSSYTEGNVCVPFDGTKQFVVGWSSNGTFGRLLSLKAGVNYKVTVYAYAYLDSNNLARAEFSHVSLYNKTQDGSQNNYVVENASTGMNEYIPVSGYFSVPTDGYYEVGFEYSGGYSTNYTAYDYFKVEQVDCAPPTRNEIISITDTSVSGTINGTGSEWEVRICTEKPGTLDDNPAYVYADTINTSSFTISGLTPNTQYWYISRTNCTNKKSEWSYPIQFTTNCSLQSVPYTNSFEDVADSRCWRKIGTEESVVVQSSTQSHLGENALKVFNATAVSPELNVGSLVGYMINGWVYNGSDSAAQFDIGVMVDPNSIETYEVVSTVSVVSSNTWEEFTAYFTILSDPDYEDFVNAKHIAISCSGDDPFYFDELYVGIVPSCPKVGKLIASVAADLTVNLNWTPAATETSWYIVTHKIVGSSDVVIADTVVTTNNIALNNFSPLTDYYFTIQALCANGDSSLITTSNVISTPCAPLDLPYLPTFGSEQPSCWDILYTVNNPTSSNHRFVYSTSKYFYATFSSGNATDTSFLVTPTFKLKTNNGIIVYLDGYLSTSYDSINPPILYTLDNGLTYDTLNVNLFNRPSRAVKTTFIPNIGPGTISFKFVDEEHKYGSYYIYGFEVEEVENCARPQDVTFAITDSVITATIVDSVASHTQYEYVYSLGEFDPDALTPTLVNGNTFTITDFELASVYNLYVRTYCSETEHSSWWKPFRFITPCEQYTSLPYYQDFESLESREEIETQCYSFYTTASTDPLTSTSCPYVKYESGTAYAVNSSKVIRWFSSSTDPIFMQLPLFTAPVNELEVEFNYRNESTTASNANLILGVMLPNDASSFIAVHTCPIQTSIATRLTVDLTESLTAGDYTGYVVAYKYGPGPSNNYYASVDDIVVRHKAKCSADPEFESFNFVSKDSVAFAYSYYADTIQVACVTSGVSPDACTNIISTTATNCGINNLVSDTKYDFYLRNVCGGVESNWVGPFSTYTSCDTIYVNDENPWVEDFDNTTPDYRFPHCIYPVQTKTENDVVYPIVMDTATSVTAPAALAMRGTNIIALPIIDKDINDCKLSFYAAGSGSIYIGAVTDINPTTFRQITSKTISATMTRYEIDLSLYSTVIGNRLALQSSTSANLFIDSLMIYTKPECFDPRSLSITDLGDTTASFSFNISPIAESIEYMVYNNVDTVVHDTLPAAEMCVVNGLTELTNYTFAVRTLCSDSTVSGWSTISFTTAAEPIVVPFTLDFEDSTLNSKLNIVNGGSAYFVIGNLSTAVKDGTSALYVSTSTSGTDNNYNQTSSSCNYAILPVLIEPGKYDISFDWKAGGEGTSTMWDYGRVFLAPMNMTFEASSSLPSGLSYNKLPSGCVALDGGALNLSSGSWENVTNTFIVNDIVRMQLVFMWRNDNSTATQPGIAYDNFKVVKYDCMNSIDSARIINVSYNSVTLNVYPNPAIHDSITYVLSDETGAVVDSTTVDLSTNNTFTITNLEDDTEFSIVMWGYCDEGKTSEISGSFTTLCAPIVVTDNSPFFEGFESCATSISFTTLFPCWTYTSVYGSSYLTSLPSSSTEVGSMPYDGNNGLRLYNSNEKVISRVFSLTQGIHEISLYAVAKVPGAEITIKYRPIEDVTDSVLITQVVGNSYQPVVAKLDIAQAGNYIISFDINTRNISSGYFAMDNLSVRKASVLLPFNLKVNNITDTSADVSWSSYNNSNKFRLYDANNTLVKDTTLVGVTNIILSGLSDNSTYTVEVNAIENATSSDTISTSFTTKCSPVYNYFNDFEGYESMTRPDCWTLEAFTSTGAEYISTYTTHPQWKVFEVAGHNGLMLESSYMDARTQNIVYSPEINITRPLLLTFDYYNNNQNSSVSNMDSLVVTIISNGVESEPILIADYQTTNNVWCSFQYDLSAYQGSSVIVKFWTRSYSYSTGRFVGIDNFSISCVTQGATYNDVTCPQSNYVGHGFNISANELVVGDTTTYTRRQTGVTCDSIITLNLFVPSPYSTVLYDTICEGQIYNKGMFNGLISPGRYTINGTSSLGCDSNVILYLAVVEVNNYLSVNLCEGQTYNFAGQTISAAGVYTDTAVNSRGCDSITVLTVTYTAKYYEETAYFCEGASYIWLKNG